VVFYPQTATASHPKVVPPSFSGLPAASGDGRSPARRRDPGKERDRGRRDGIPAAVFLRAPGGESRR